MRRFAGLLVFLFLLACSGLLNLEAEERFYAERMALMDELGRATKDGALKTEIEAAKSAFEAEYAALPPDEDDRYLLLSPMTTRIGEANSDFEERLDASAKEVLAVAKAAEDAEIEVYKKEFYGTWSGGGVTISISPGHVDYQKNKGSTNTSINAPIQSFAKEYFEVGMFGINTTFEIDEAPHQKEDGTWHMTLDEVELTKIADF
jgi:hypothetical protein